MTACDIDLLVSYLYDECDETDRARVDAHLAQCGACSRELRAWRAVREDLTKWTPPERALDFRIVQESRGQGVRPGWLGRHSASWGLAAAAVLVLAVAAGLANIEVRYGADGVIVRTGWGPSAPSSAQRAAGEVQGQALRPFESPRAAPSNVEGRQTSEQARWRADLAALERQLRSEFLGASGRAADARPAGPGAAPADSARSDAELLRRMRALVEDSERRQQRELALRVAELVRDMDTQRRADLLRIQQGFGQLEGLTGAEVARQRQMLNYLVRVSQQQR